MQEESWDDIKKRMQGLDYFLEQMSGAIQHWEAYKTTGHPLHLLRVMNDVDHIASIQQISKTSLLRKIGHGLGEMTEESFPNFCMIEAGKAIGTFATDSDEYLRARYILQKFSLEASGRNVLASYRPFEYSAALHAFAKAVCKPLSHEATWARAPATIGGPFVAM